jgi:hypothetical protein
MLMERGFSRHEIDWAMRQMVGEDWRELQANVLYKRLLAKGYIYLEDQDAMIDDLEALVRGSHKLDYIYFEEEHLARERLISGQEW